MLSILTFNTKHGEQINSFLKYLDSEDLKFDILCFQEFPKSFIPKLGKFICTKGFNIQYSTYRITKGGDEFGNLTLINNEKVKILDSSVINLKSGFIDNTVRPKLWGTNISINALKSQVDYKGKKFVLFNTQLTAFSHNITRYRQLNTLIKDSSKTKSGLIVGDLNIPNISRIDLEDFENTTKGMKTYNFHKVKYQTDYILIKNVDVKKTHILKTLEEFSDHSPLVGYFEI